KTSIHGQITDAVSISERPAVVEDRALPGHWEGDLLFGSKNSQIATLVERQARYVMLAKVGKKATETVVNPMISHSAQRAAISFRSDTSGIGPCGFSSWSSLYIDMLHRALPFGIGARIFDLCCGRNGWACLTN